jgi:hypothetical protein
MLHWDIDRVSLKHVLHLLLVDEIKVVLFQIKGRPIGIEGRFIFKFANDISVVMHVGLLAESQRFF